MSWCLGSVCHFLEYCEIEQRALITHHITAWHRSASEIPPLICNTWLRADRKRIDKFNIHYPEPFTVKKSKWTLPKNSEEIAGETLFCLKHSCAFIFLCTMWEKKNYHQIHMCHFLKLLGWKHRGEVLHVKGVQQHLEISLSDLSGPNSVLLPKNLPKFYITINYSYI